MQQRPTTSLPAPGAPVISTRLPVGATRSICWRSWLAAERSADQIEFAAGAQLQFLVLAPQQRRLDRPRTINSSRSDLNGFSMKS